METPNSYLNLEAKQVPKCFFCDKFLSVPPIFTSSLGNVCGRCKFAFENKEEEWARQTVYENMAQFMVFPCSNVNSGCTTKLKWGEVTQHEDTCLSKDVKCPFSIEDFVESKCQWVGSAPLLNHHLETDHADSIGKLPDIIFSELEASRILMTRCSKHLVILAIKWEHLQKFTCLIMVNGTSTDCESYQCQLELFDTCRNNSMILRRRRVEDVLAMERILYDQDKVFSIDLEIIRDFLKTRSEIIGRFRVIKRKKPSNTKQRFGNALNEHTLDDIIFKDLECPICKFYLLPPIEICASGHSLCSRCRGQVEVCPTCRSPFNDGRNYSLERITASMKFPCTFKEAGCYQTFSGENLRKHEDECTFAEVKCPLRCAGGPVVNILKHIGDRHKDSLLVFNDLNILDVDDRLSGRYALVFGCDVFTLDLNYCAKDFMGFSLKLFELNDFRYTYNLEILNSVNNTEKISFTKDSRQLLSSAEEDEHWVVIPHEMIAGYIANGLIFFKIMLKKLD